MNLIKKQSEKPKFYQNNFKIISPDERLARAEKHKKMEAERKARERAEKAAECLARGDKVFLEYSFDPHAKNWPHGLELVEPHGDMTEPLYWMFTWHFDRFVAERMDWKQGQALDRNAGIFGFQTKELAMLIKLSWSPDMVELPG